MSKRVVRGKFAYEDEETKKKKSKKQRRKEELKALKLKDKEIAKQCECNHLDRKHNKTHFKDEDGYKVCKICGGRIINDPDMLTDETVQSAVEVLYSVMSIVRNRMSVSEEMDEAITQTLRINSRAPELIKMLKDDHYSAKKHDGKKHKKDGKKKKKNKDNKKFYRVAY